MIDDHKCSFVEILLEIKYGVANYWAMASLCTHVSEKLFIDRIFRLFLVFSEIVV